MRIYIHGNCQSSLFRKTLQEARPDWHLTNSEVHAVKLDQPLDEYIDNVRSADVIVSQPIGETYRDERRLSSAWILENKKPDTPVIMFVPLHFSVYTPQLGYMPSLRSFRMDYFDFNLVACFLAGRSVSETLDIVNDEALYGADFIEQTARLAIEELRRRERAAKADLIISDLVEDNFRNELLFYTHNHPTRRLAVRVADRLMKRLGEAHEFDVQGPEYLDEMIVSPSPSVLKALALDVGQFTGMIRAGKRDMTLEAYISATFEHYQNNIERTALEDIYRNGKDAVNYRAKIKEAGKGRVSESLYSLLADEKVEGSL